MDIGLDPARAYDVALEAEGSRPIRFHIGNAALPLVGLGNAGHVTLMLAVAGRTAAPTRVELTRKDLQWYVTRVRHG